MRLLLFLLLLLPLTLSAKQFSYTQVHQMPKSIEKDYYIWRLLKQRSTSKADAVKLIHEAKRISPKLSKAYRKKTGKKAPIKKQYKKPLSAQAKARLQKRQLHTRELLKSRNPIAAWLKESDKEKLFIFNNAGGAGRKKLDQTLSPALWSQLCRYPGINRMVSRIMKEPLPKLRKALLYPPPAKSALSYTSLNKLAFYALSKGENRISSSYFERSAAKAWDRERADRGLFWAYMTSKKKKYLKAVVKSYDINLYTLLARDILKLKYPQTITPALPKARLLSQEKINSPIYWAKLKKKIFSKGTDLNQLATQYKAEGSIGYYTFIKTKASREKEQYFPMPYRALLGKLPKTRQAMMYAIARQESRFIPGSISSSYALGLMQIMPFLVDHLAKQRKEKIDYDDMFDPKTSLIYANAHMNYLTKWLQHPLYIAYAYNAGIGFTRKILRKKGFFRSNKGYEPYLSIERLPNEQANKYGKHVLVNYVIYMNKLGVPLRMTELLNTLHIPSKTDKFRK
jgi:soluble lytic murein transglycosylase